MGYSRSMRVKTSVSLAEETIRTIDSLASGSNRSRVIEDAVREFAERRRRAARDERDLRILNRAADALNREMEDVLEYQVEP